MVHKAFRGHNLGFVAVIAIAGFAALGILLHTQKTFAALDVTSVTFQETVSGTTDTTGHSFTVKPKAGNTSTNDVSSGTTTVNGTKSGANVVYKGTIKNVSIQTGGRECTNGCQYQYQVCDTTNNTCSAFWSSGQVPTTVTLASSSSSGGNGNGGGSGGTACPTGSTKNSDGSCSCNDGSVVQAGDKCSASSNTTCGGGSWDWAICPTDTLFQTVAQKLLDFMQNLLDINTTGANGIFNVGDSSGNGKAYYEAWNSFRIIGTAVVVIAGLVMVSSQALGFEVFDAYTIRKVLPRLLIAIIAMSLSWPLLAFAIGFFNTLGRDIQGIMYAPFQTLPNHAGLSDGIVSWGFVGTIFLAMGSNFGDVLLPILGTGALALLLAVLILIIRQIGVTILVISAPLAIACYVLPNTKKVWDLWKDNFLGLMVMYPIVMMFIAAGEIFGAVGKSSTNPVDQIVGIIAFFVPYFLIPLAFRMATGLIGTITGMVNDRSKGGFDRLRAGRQNMIKKRTENLRAGNAWKGAPEGSRRAKLNRGLFVAGNINQAGLKPGDMKDNFKGFESRHSINAAKKMLEEDEAMKLWSGNEDYTNAYLKAGGNYDKMRQILASQTNSAGERIYDDGTISQAISQVRHSRKGVSDDVFNKAAVLSLPGTGTAFATKWKKDANGNDTDEVESGGAGEMARRINEVWGEDRVGSVSALVTARQAAAQARRFDLAGNGTAASIGHMNEMWDVMKANTPQKNASAAEVAAANAAVDASEAQVAETTIRESLKGQGGNYIAGSRQKAVASFAPIIGKDIKAQLSQNQGDNAIFAQTLRQYADLGGRYDAMSGGPPENVDELQKVMEASVTVSADFAKQINDAAKAANPGLDKDVIVAGAATNRDVLEAARYVPGFLDRRRELGSRTAQAAATLNAQVAAGGGPQPGSPIAPVGGGSPLPGPMG